MTEPPGAAGARASLAPLRERFPGWRFWHGTTTGSLWAVPPAAHAEQELVNAPDALTLAAEIDEIERRRGPVPPARAGGPGRQLAENSGTAITATAPVAVVLVRALQRRTLARSPSRGSVAVRADNRVSATVVRPEAPSRRPNMLSAG